MLRFVDARDLFAEFAPQDNPCLLAVGLPLRECCHASQAGVGFVSGRTCKIPVACESINF